jgi:hypothetical protein
MTYLPGEKKLLLACTGDYVSVAGSGIVALDLGVLPLAVAAVLPAASAGNRAFSNATVAAFDGNTVFAVSLGDFSNTPPDTLWLLALNGAPAVTIHDSTEAFSLGSVLVDAERGRVFVVDGTTQKPAWLRIFERVGGRFAETGQVKTNPSQKLPPRGLGWF